MVEFGGGGRHSLPVPLLVLVLLLVVLDSATLLLVLLLTAYVSKTMEEGRDGKTKRGLFTTSLSLTVRRTKKVGEGGQPDLPKVLGMGFHIELH